MIHNRFLEPTVLRSYIRQQTRPSGGAITGIPPAGGSITGVGGVGAGITGVGPAGGAISPIPSSGGGVGVATDGFPVAPSGPGGMYPGQVPKSLGNALELPTVSGEEPPVIIANVPNQPNPRSPLPPVWNYPDPINFPGGVGDTPNIV